MVAFVIVAGVISATMDFAAFASVQGHLMNSTITRDRIWTSIRVISGMPAAIRNSARAAGPDGVTALNPELRNCINGVNPGQCLSGVESGFAMFSPVVNVDPLGNRLGIQQITSPIGSANPLRFSAFGTPCTQGEPECIFFVTTSFKPRCGPPALPAVPPPDLLNPVNLFAPTAACTVADFVEINYYIQVDPVAAALSRGLGGVIGNKSGTVLVSVKDISGNDAQ
jgi:hypothetical protein